MGACLIHCGPLLVAICQLRQATAPPQGLVPFCASKRKIDRPESVRIGMAAAAQARDRAMALHCSSSWLIRASSSGKLGNSPRSIPE
jgi:hypothetical protein